MPDSDDIQGLTMAEAGRRMGVSGRSAKRALRGAGVLLYQRGRGFVVAEKALAAFLLARLDYAGRGRPTRKEQTQEAGSDSTVDKLETLIEALSPEQREELKRRMESGEARG